MINVIRWALYYTSTIFLELWSPTITKNWKRSLIGKKLFQVVYFVSMSEAWTVPAETSLFDHQLWGISLRTDDSTSVGFMVGDIAERTAITSIKVIIRRTIRKLRFYKGMRKTDQWSSHRVKARITPIFKSTFHHLLLGNIFDSLSLSQIEGF